MCQFLRKLKAINKPVTVRMGNKRSSPSCEPTLPPVASESSSRLPPDAVALRDLSSSMRTSATELSAEYLDGIVFLVYDQATGELLFILDERWEFPDYYFDDGKMLVGSKGEPLVIVETKYAATNRYLIKTPQLRFTDGSSSEKVLVEAESNYEERKSVLWFTRGEVVARKKKRVEWLELVGAITLKEDFLCEIEVESKVDLTIIALVRRTPLNEGLGISLSRPGSLVEGDCALAITPLRC